MLYSSEDDPRKVKESVNLKESKLWKSTMEEEMESFGKNKTWDLVALPNGRKLIGSKWVFKKKMNLARKVEKYKSRLVEKGYS